MVSPDAIRTVVGILGNIIALGLFLSPLPTFVRICKKRSVEEFSAFPYLATLVNCMLWVVYGLPLVHPHSTLVVTINGSGMAIELAYVLLYLLFSRGSKRTRVAALLLCELAFVGAVLWLVLALAHTYQRRSLVVGSFCIVFGTGMYVAPLSVMKLVIQSKSVEYMPLSISLASFLNGLCWTTYALIRFDLFITIPNGLGVLFALAQLILYGVYYKSTQKIIQARKRKEAANVGLSEVRVMNTTTTKQINDLPQTQP